MPKTYASTTEESLGSLWWPGMNPRDGGKDSARKKGSPYPRTAPEDSDVSSSSSTISSATIHRLREDSRSSSSPRHLDSNANNTHEVKNKLKLGDDYIFPTWGFRDIQQRSPKKREVVITEQEDRRVGPMKARTSIMKDADPLDLPTNFHDLAFPEKEDFNDGLFANGSRTPLPGHQRVYEGLGEPVEPWGFPRGGGEEDIMHMAGLEPPPPPQQWFEPHARWQEVQEPPWKPQRLVDDFDDANSGLYGARFQQKPLSDADSMCTAFREHNLGFGSDGRWLMADAGP